ncbi:unnamed protein product [Brassica rapa subsp. narinosa]
MSLTTTIIPGDPGCQLYLGVNRTRAESVIGHLKPGFQNEIQIHLPMNESFTIARATSIRTTCNNTGKLKVNYSTSMDYSLGINIQGTFDQSNSKANEVLLHLKRFSMAPAVLGALFSVGVAFADSDEVADKISSPIPI